MHDMICSCIVQSPGRGGLLERWKDAAAVTARGTVFQVKMPEEWLLIM